MKILFVSPYFYPAQYFGGPVQAVFKLCKELVKRKHEVVVYTSDAKSLSERFDTHHEKIEGIDVHYFRNLSMWSAKASRLFLTEELNRSLRANLPAFDIVYANEYTTYQNILLHHFAQKYRVPYVIQARGSIPRIGRVGRKIIFDNLFGKKILQDASSAIALTKSEFYQYRCMGVKAGKIALIPNGINMADFTSLPPKGRLRAKYKIPADKKIILYLGRIHSIKGIDVLVNAFALGKKKNAFQDAVLVISGSDDGYLEELKNLINRENLSNEIIFTGPLYGEEKLSAYLDSYVFVLSSYYEAFPNVVLEAYGCSKPVIASNVESISDIVLNGSTGLLFDAGNPESLADKIIYALANPEEMERMGLNAKNLVETKYSMTCVMDSFEALLETIVKNTKLSGYSRNKL